MKTKTQKTLHELLNTVKEYQKKEAKKKKDIERSVEQELAS